MTSLSSVLFFVYSACLRFSAELFLFVIFSTFSFALVQLSFIYRLSSRSLRNHYLTLSLFSMLSAILKSQWFFNSCWISIKSWVWRNNDNVSFVVSESTCLLKCFNCLIHCFFLMNHISNFSKACRMINVLNVLFLIFVKSFQNCSIEYFINNVTITFWMIWSCQCL